MRFVTTAFVLGALVWISSQAAGQPAPGDIGLFADAGYTQTSMNVSPGEPYTIHLVAFDLAEGIRSFAFSYSGLSGASRFADVSIEWGQQHPPCI